MILSTAPESDASFKRPRFALLAATVLLLCSSPSLAARAVRAAEVTVAATAPAAAFPDAMRAALVRLTGVRDADQDPVFAGLIADAKRFVQIYRPAAGGGTQVSFDGAALERAVLATGRTVWPRERPVALVVVESPPAGADAATLQRSLEDTANQRGLPVQFSSISAAGLRPGAEVTAEAALAAARRLGADVALIGRADNGNWSWTLVTAAAAESFSGAVSAGIHGATDALARATETVMAQPELEAMVRVSGVLTLRDYAQVTRLLAATPGVRAVSVIEIGGPQAVYRVVARGGGEAIARALAGSAALRPDPADAAGLAFRFER